MRQDAIDLSKVLNEPTIQDLSYAYDEAATQVVKILNYMGIPFDRETNALSSGMTKCMVMTKPKTVIIFE